MKAKSHRATKHMAKMSAQEFLELSPSDARAFPSGLCIDFTWKESQSFQQLERIFALINKRNINQVALNFYNDSERDSLVLLEDLELVLKQSLYERRRIQELTITLSHWNEWDQSASTKTALLHSLLRIHSLGKDPLLPNLQLNIPPMPNFQWNFLLPYLHSGSFADLPENVPPLKIDEKGSKLLKTLFKNGICPSGLHLQYQFLPDAKYWKSILSFSFPQGLIVDLSSPKIYLPDFSDEYLLQIMTVICKPLFGIRFVLPKVLSAFEINNVLLSNDTNLAKSLAFDFYFYVDPYLALLLGTSNFSEIILSYLASPYSIDELESPLLVSRQAAESQEAKPRCSLAVHEFQTLCTWEKANNLPKIYIIKDLVAYINQRSEKEKHVASSKPGLFKSSCEAAVKIAAAYKGIHFIISHYRMDFSLPKKVWTSKSLVFIAKVCKRNLGLLEKNELIAIQQGSLSTIIQSHPFLQEWVSECVAYHKLEKYALDRSKPLRAKAAEKCLAMLSDPGKEPFRPSFTEREQRELQEPKLAKIISSCVKLAEDTTRTLQKGSGGSRRLGTICPLIYATKPFGF